MTESTTQAEFENIIETQLAQRGGTDYIEVLNASNLVAMVPDAPKPFVVKIPRVHTDPYHSLAHEAHTLRLLAAAEGCPFRFPRLLEEQPGDSTAPPYLVTEYMPGNVISNPNSLTPAQRYGYGRDVARYGLWLWNAFKPEQLLALEVEDPKHNAKPYVHANPYKVLAPVTSFNEPEYPVLTDLMHWGQSILQRYDLWPLQKGQLGPTNGDLRLANSVLDDEGQLTAIIDHGYLSKSTLNVYGRGVAPLGPDAMQGLNDTFEVHGIPAISDELAAFYSGIFLAAKLARTLRRELPYQMQIPIWADIVRQAYPERDWTEFDRFQERQ